MQLVLKWTSVLFIVVGFIYAFSQFSSLKEQHKDVQYWKEAAEEEWDNNLIEERYNSLNNSYKSSLALTLIPFLSSIVSGIFFLALASIINLLQQLVINANKPLATPQDYIQASDTKNT
jgi:hypothetical protein